MSFYSTPTTYNSLLGQEDIPATMLPDSKSKMIPCKTAIKSVRTSSASLGAGSMGLWQINTGAGTGFLKANSVYLRAKVDITAAQGAGAWRFSGPSEVASASALISRLTISNGSQMLSQLTNYNVWHDVLLSHATSNDYVRMDSVIYEMTGVARNTVANADSDAVDKTVYITIPLMSPIFNSSQSIPLFLMNSPLTIEILFNSVADAISAATIVPTAFTVSDAEIVYEEVAISPELKSSIMGRLQGGSVWKQYLDSIYALQTSSTSGLSFNLGVGLSSCKGILACDRNATGDLVLNGYSNSRFFLDGQLVNNFDLSNSAIVFSELNRTLHSMHDSNITSSLDVNLSPAGTAAGGATPSRWTDFVADKFVYGVSTQSVNDFSIAFSGQPVQMIIVQTFNASAANSPLFPYATAAEGGTFANGRNKIMFVLYDELLTIDANGVCSLLR